MRRLPTVLTAVLITAISGGCGSTEGVREGATVSVYADAGVCAGAGKALAAAGREAGLVRVDLRCLPLAHRDDRLDLAAVGANARRATQDSTTVAYLLERGPAARFATPVLDAAGIGWTTGGEAAMKRVTAAIEAADPSGSLREEVAEALDAA